MAGHFLVVSVVCGKRSIRARAELRPKMGKKAELTSVQPRTGFISFHFSLRVEASLYELKMKSTSSNRPHFKYFCFNNNKTG